MVSHLQKTTEVEGHYKACKVLKMSGKVVERACIIAVNPLDTAEIVIERRAEQNPFLKEIVVSDEVRTSVTYEPC